VSAGHRPDFEAAGGELRDPQSPERDLGGALHEVSNALTVVLGWLEAAHEDLPATDPSRRAVEIALSRAKFARRLARRAIGDDSEPLDEEVDLGAVIRDAITGVEREAARKKIEIAVAASLGGRGCIARSAPALLQVLTNLLLNAIAMSPQGSTVTVETFSSDTFASLAVVDEGPGISPERRERIFEGGVSTRKGGAGVGLKHARMLARGAGGSLDVGHCPRGARFEITWPLRAMMAPPPRSSSIPMASLEGIRVLLLEDDDAVIGLLSTALELRGAEVVAARTSTELTSVVAEQSFDAALLDLSPIAKDVGGALQRVRERSPTARLVLISGSAAEIPEPASSEMAAWVRKPFEVGEILAILRNLRPRSR
jgi:CheY-like chemotaxis protein